MANKTLTIKDICDGYTTDSGLTAIGSGVSYDPSVANKLIIHEELDDYGASSGELTDKAKKVVSTVDNYTILDEHYATIKCSISWSPTWTYLRISATHGADTIGSVTLKKGVASGNLKINYLRTLEGETANLAVFPSGSGTVNAGTIYPSTVTLKHNSTVNATVTY